MSYRRNKMETFFSVSEHVYWHVRKSTMAAQSRGFRQYLRWSRDLALLAVGKAVRLRGSAMDGGVMSAILVGAWLLPRS